MSHYYSQNETINKKLLKNLIDKTSISKGDLVYDIGAGAGNITEALLAKGAHVISIEKDGYLFNKLQHRFFNREAVSLHHTDFLNWEFSGHRYKVFANIPFIQTADIIRKLLYCGNPPDDCYLIIQKEAALKYAGVPKETLASLLIKPRFWVGIVYYFDRKDFNPAPAVDIVLVQFERRKCQLVPGLLYMTYRDFIVFLREESAGNIKSALKHLFTYPQINHISTLLNIYLQQKTVELNFLQYLGIFQFLLTENPVNLSLVRGAEKRLVEQRAHLKKIHRTRQ
jgi:23S rRNA (adenine-N6)-dimethyltransferase